MRVYVAPNTERFNITEIINKVESVINYFKNWFSLMKGVISLHSSRFVTPIYEECLKIT